MDNTHTRYSVRHWCNHRDDHRHHQCEHDRQKQQPAEDLNREDKYFAWILLHVRAADCFVPNREQDRHRDNEQVPLLMNRQRINKGCIRQSMDQTHCAPPAFALDELFFASRFGPGISASRNTIRLSIPASTIESIAISLSRPRPGTLGGPIPDSISA